MTEDSDAAAAVTRARGIGAAVIAALVALASVNLWLGYRDHLLRSTQRMHQQMIEAAQVGVVSLTTIDHEQADEDVRRILDASTGSFRDDFAQRATGFADAARKAQSKSVGTVAAAGLESVDGDVGRVLVALTVMTSNRGVPERQPRAWRVRVTVVNADDAYKVSGVEFIP